MSGTSYFSRYARSYDRFQPVAIEMYRHYHDLALDFVPFDRSESFRMLDLGSGTGTFLASVLDRYPEARCVAFDYAPEMIEIAREKVGSHLERVEFQARDLNHGLPGDIGRFQLVTSFSTIHHLTDENKRLVFRQVAEVLEPAGWFFLIDAMTVMFDDGVFARGNRRHETRRRARFEEAGIDLNEVQAFDELKARIEADAPDLDRISPLADQLEWLREAGFRSVDRIWHFWMEHFIIARR